MANLAPYFSLRLLQPDLGPYEIELNSWGELGSPAGAEDMWSGGSREAWRDLLEPRTFEELESGLVGVLRLSSEDWRHFVERLRTSESEPQSHAWIEARDLRDGTWMIYPNDASTTIYVALFSLVRRNESAALLTTTALTVGRHGTLGPTVSDGARPCKFHITWPDGVRRVDCRNATCPHRCEPLLGTSPAGFPTVDCPC